VRVLKNHGALQSYFQNPSSEKKRKTKPLRAICLVALLATLLTNLTFSEGFVLAMSSDGQLKPSVPKNSFARTYGDGQREESSSLILFGSNEPERNSAPLASSAPRPVPTSSILAGIDATALRYAGHPALRRARMTVSDWQALFRPISRLKAPISVLTSASQKTPAFRLASFPITPANRCSASTNRRSAPCSSLFVAFRGPIAGFGRVRPLPETSSSIPRTGSTGSGRFAWCVSALGPRDVVAFVPSRAAEVRCDARSGRPRTRPPFAQIPPALSP